jgi:hypothetical protein
MDYQEMEKALEIARKQRDEFRVQRDSMRQIAFGLAEHCKMIHKKWPNIDYPHTLIKKVDLARGIGAYEFPVRNVARDQAIIRSYHTSPEHLRNMTHER